MKKRTQKSILALVVAVVLAIPAVFAAGEPTNVSGVSAVATSPTAISLSWTGAQNGTGGLVSKYRIYYDTKSVQNGEAFEYQQEVETPNNNTSYSLMGLEPGTTYYFAITAIDGAGLESVEYSVETNATTQAGAAADTIPPIVMSVVSLDATHVTVKFSEKVKLPELLPAAAFTINEQITPANALEVSDAVSYLTVDPSGKIVLLETATQTKNMNYVVTASVAITDVAGNPIVSGSTDSGLFAGSDKVSTITSMEEAAGTEAPVEEVAEGEEAEVDTETTTEETPVTLPNATPVNPLAANCGNIDESNPASDATSVMGCFEVKFKACEPATYTKTTEKDGQKTTHLYEIVTGNGNICDVSTKVVASPKAEWLNKEMTCSYSTDGTFVEGEKEVLDSFPLTQKLGSCKGELYALMLADQAVVVDTTPPEDITGIILTFKQQLDGFMVFLSWTASLNTAKDLVDQVIYQSMDRGATYDLGKSLGASATSTSVNSLEAGKEYFFKITTKDAAGNESVGAVKSIRLPQTGIGAGILLLGSAFGAKAALRRKRRK